MPQGKMKIKVQVPCGKKNKQAQTKKQLGILKKGRMAIAPKKTKHVEAKKMNKTISNAINRDIEQEMKGRATGMEAKSFTIVGQGQGEGKKEVQKN